jgi:hypothetical protein
MEAKAYALILIALIVGVIGGYVAGSMPFQNQVQTTPLPSVEIESFQDVLNDLEHLGCSIVNVTEVSEGKGIGILVEYSEFREVAYNKKIVFIKYENEIPFLFTFFDDSVIVWNASELGYLPSEPSQQAQTQVRIDTVAWDVTGDSVTITVRNTGSIPAQIESISVRTNVGGSDFHTLDEDVSPHIR